MNGRHRGNGVTSKTRQEKYARQYARTEANKKRRAERHKRFLERNRHKNPIRGLEQARKALE